MAGDWIKMRGALLQSPKLIGMSRHLHDSQEFRDWLTPGGSGGMNGQTVSDDALRCVTSALLLRVWSASREFGKFVGDDLRLSHMTLSDLDAMAGAPGVGEAMAAVGWASESDTGNGVTLPNFKQHNVPMSNSEKQSEYRKRKGVTDVGNSGVTDVLPNSGNAKRQNVTTREEKRREEEEGINTGAKPPRPTAIFTPPTLEDVRAYCIERRNSVDPERWHDHYTSNGWMVGKSKMKDWRAAVRTWEKNEFERGPPKASQQYLTAAEKEKAKTLADLKFALESQHEFADRDQQQP